MMMMMLCKSRAQVKDLCVEINNFKLPVMQTTPIFTTFSAHRKMAAEKRGQIKVFGRIYTIVYIYIHITNYYYILYIYIYMYNIYIYIYVQYIYIHTRRI